MLDVHMMQKNIANVNVSKYFGPDISFAYC